MDIERVLSIPQKNTYMRIKVYESYMHQEIKVIAKEEGTTVENIMNNLLSEFLNEYNTHQTPIVETKPKKRDTLTKVFMSIMDYMAPKDSDGVIEEELIKEMLLSGKWEDEDSAKEFLQNCHMNSLIFEPSIGKYALVKY